MNYIKMANILTIFLLLIFSISAQDKFAEDEKMNPCFQDNEEKTKLIEKAEKEEYNIKYTEIVGNTYTRYVTFYKKFGLNKNFPFNEGDIFRKESLFKAVEGFNKVKTIYPINIDNVEVWLQQTEVKDRIIKQINFTFCVKQKDKK